MSASILSASHTLPPKAPVVGEQDYVDADSLRTTFALAMSAMYSAEVPLYSDLIRIVQNVNRTVLAQASPSSPSTLSQTDNGENKAAGPVHHDSVQRLTLERHGAIRLGTPQELHTVRRIFALMGMYPVGYYDLAVANLPMHATCFRPIASASLEANPFRVFTTLLRPDLLTSTTARETALRLLSKRQIFSPTLRNLLDIAEAAAAAAAAPSTSSSSSSSSSSSCSSALQGGRLTSAQAEVFVTEALRSFSWQPIAAATHEEYTVLRNEHPILADIACFRSAHINHLTPRALDIDLAQRSMIAEAINVKDRIEGPPRRKCPILLRQTSFLALEEGIRFPSRESDDGDHDDDVNHLVEGHHKARFGEIEERGAAVTGKGRKLYDELLEEAAAVAAAAAAQQEANGNNNNNSSEEAYAKVFEKFPDTWDELRRQKLIYCEYTCESNAREKLASLDLSLSSSSSTSGGGDDDDDDDDDDEKEKEKKAKATAQLLEMLVQRGILTARPLTYEDFLPFSAAGIFQSNLQSKQQQPVTAASPPPPPSKAKVSGGDREGYERAMQCSALDSDQLYAEAQRRSLEKCAAELGLDVGIVADLV